MKLIFNCKGEKSPAESLEILDYYKFVCIVQVRGARVPHNKAKFEQIVPELIYQEPLVTENTCKYFNCKYSMELASHKFSSLFLLKWES